MRLTFCFNGAAAFLLAIYPVAFVPPPGWVRAAYGAVTQRAASNSSGAGRVTFNKDVAPIIFRRCSGCHHTGEVAPFPLMTYQDVKVRAKPVELVTENHYMPPWGPEPGYANFKNVRRLTAKEIETIKQWVAEGAPEGKAEDLPPAPRFADGWQLGQPDLVLEMPGAYEVLAGSPEFYRCFPVPTGLTTDRYLKALEFRPSGDRVVHHAILVQDANQAGRRL